MSRQTKGVPRLLNQSAHQALYLAAEAGAAQVDAEAALEVLALLGLTEEMEESGAIPVLDGGRVEDEPREERTEANDAAAERVEGIENEDASCRLILSSARG